MRFLFKSVFGRPRGSRVYFGITRSGDYIGNKTLAPHWYAIYGNWWN
jgi:hypothetical protein